MLLIFTSLAFCYNFGSSLPFCLCRPHASTIEVKIPDRLQVLSRRSTSQHHLDLWHLSRPTRFRRSQKCFLHPTAWFRRLPAPPDDPSQYLTYPRSAFRSPFHSKLCSTFQWYMGAMFLKDGRGHFDVRSGSWGNVVMALGYLVGNFFCFHCLTYSLMFR